MAFSPGFLVTVSVTAGYSARRGPSLGAPRHATHSARRAAAVAHRGHVAQEHRLAARTPTTRSATSLRVAQEGPGLDRPPRGCREQVAHRQAQVGRQQRLAQVGHVTPAPAMRAGSSSTITARPGPPIVRPRACRARA
jgi:hypothetical protein